MAMIHFVISLTTDIRHTLYVYFFECLQFNIALLPQSRDKNVLPAHLNRTCVPVCWLFIYILSFIFVIVSSFSFTSIDMHTNTSRITRDRFRFIVFIVGIFNFVPIRSVNIDNNNWKIEYSKSVCRSLFIFRKSKLNWYLLIRFACEYA